MSRCNEICKVQMSLLRQSSYDILQLNHHDATIHSCVTGHDWIIVSNYRSPDCYILHRHSRKDPFHRQHGNYKSLEEAIHYINHHEKWVEAKH